jgi:hypothetical protein
MSIPIQFHPINVFSLAEFEIDIEVYTNYLKEFFFNLEWDDYLFRLQRLEFLSKNLLLTPILEQTFNPFFRNYYKGEEDIACLQNLIEKLSSNQLKDFFEIKPTRRRAMQAFKVYFDNHNINIIPTFENRFCQDEALVFNHNNDWRSIARTFSPPPVEMINEELIHIIKSLSNKIRLFHSNLYSINIFVHFTQIICEPLGAATNSPEGIHQDGMDYIVSALVIDRKNVQGGKSIIYQGNDNKNPFFETILQEGYGLLQPDKGTSYWHIVEPITAIDKSKPAYRSTIGIDFKLSFACNGRY